MKILEKKSKRFGFIEMFSVLVLLASGSLMASTLGNAQKEELSPFIDNFSLDLSLYIGNPKMTKSNLLKMFTFNKEVPLIGITNSKKIIIIDLSAKKIVQTLEIPDIHSIVTVDGCKDYFIHYGEIMQLSRYDSQSWEKRWTILYPFTNGGSVKIQKKTTSFKIPMVMNRIPDTNTLFLKGIQLVQSDSKNYSPICGLVKINMDTGKTIEEINYDFRRKLGNNLSLCMNEPLTNFDIINEVTGEITISGNCEPDDLLYRKDRYHAIDLKNLRDIMPFGWNWDFSGIVTEGGTILFSRKYSNSPFKTGISKASWVYFDAMGNRLRKEDNIYPMMLYRLPNLTKEAYPIVLPNNKHKGRSMEVDSFWIIERNGTMTKVPIPQIQGIKRFTIWAFQDKWAHAGNEIFLNHKGTLYGFTAGEKTAQALLQGDKKNTTFRFVTGKVNIYAMKIVNGVGNTLMRLSDQKVGIPSEFSNDLPPEAWSQIVSFSKLAAFAPKNAMGNNKLKYTNKYAHTKNGHRIWGDFDTLNELGDITNLTAFRKDKTAVLVGMRIPENTLEYCIPLLHIPGFNKMKYPSGNYLPFASFRINDREALLLVFKTLNQIKVYRIKRPGMVL